MKRTDGRTRREALQAISALAGTTAIGGLSACGDVADAPGDTDLDSDLDSDDADPLSRIKHVVVLMMENRSFDHYLGTLSLLEGRDDVDGLAPGMSNPDADGVQVEPFHLAIDCQEDPPHSWTGSHTQFADGTNQGFVLAHQGGRGETSHESMGYYTRDDLPVFYAFADAHTICDRWFCSVMGPTWPNRFYSVCGTSDGMQSNDWGRIPFPARSIYAELTDAGVSWRVYYHAAPFAALLADAGGVLGDNIRPIDDLFTDLAAGRLPQVVVIEPGYSTNSDHPPQDVLLGQALVGTVYKALAASSVWNETVLIVDYDEHGGLFDHVAPPKSDDDHAADGFDQLGFRIPGMVLGPWAKPGACIHTQFDHTSVLKTIQELHGLEPLTKRNAAAVALWDCLDLEAMAAGTPHPDAVLPTIEIDLDRVGRGCGASSLADHQPELAKALDAGLVDARFDRRLLAEDTLERMLVRAEKLGVIKIVNGR